MKVYDPRLLPSVVLEFEGSVRWRMNRLLAFVGEAPACKVRIASESVSRFHAALVGAPGRLWVVDTLSRRDAAVER